MVLAQKQKYRPMKLDKKPKDKPTHTQSLIYDKGGKNIQWRKKNLFKNWYWESWTAICKNMQLEHFLTPYKR